jgi:hypothetical protein
MSSMPTIPIRVNIKNKMNKINETNDDVDFVLSDLLTKFEKIDNKIILD